MFPSSGVIKPSINAAIANNTMDIDNNMIACFKVFLLLSYDSLKVFLWIKSSINLKTNKNSNIPAVQVHKNAGISIIHGELLIPNRLSNHMLI